MECENENENDSDIDFHDVADAIEERQNSDDAEYPNCDLTIWLRSCDREVSPQTVNGDVVTGQIPTWLQGSLVRNGPGGIHVYGDTPESSCKHLFDGPGLLQKFQFSNGRVTYASRFINTKSHQRNAQAQRLVLSEFGTVATPDPCQTIFDRVSTIFTNEMEKMMTDTANISIHPFGDEIYSLAETPFAHRIDLETLDTVQTINANSEMGIINHTSHPHVSQSENKVYNIGQKLDIWNGPHYIIAEMSTATATATASDPQEKDADLKRAEKNSNEATKSPWATAKIVATIPSRWLLNICYMHSFALTDNYFILIEQPLSIFFPEIPFNHICRPKPISSTLQYFPEENTIFHIIPRNKGKPDSKFQNQNRRTFESPAFFFLHTINAYEKDTEEEGTSEVVIDICCYDDPKMIDCMYVDALENAQLNPDYAKLFRGRPKRFRFNISDTETESETEVAKKEDGGIASKEGHPKYPKPEDCTLTKGELIVDFGCETPRINYDSYDGKKYTYFYAISSDVDLGHPGWLVKVNVDDKSYKMWGEPELHSYPSEPIFVASPNSAKEDDGIILSTLVYGGECVLGPNQVSVAILCAQKWELLAKIDFQPGSCIPKCLHGWFFPDRDRDRDRSHDQQVNSKMASK